MLVRSGPFSCFLVIFVAQGCSSRMWTVMWRMSSLRKMQMGFAWGSACPFGFDLRFTLRSAVVELRMFRLRNRKMSRISGNSGCQWLHLMTAGPERILRCQGAGEKTSEVERISQEAHASPPLFRPGFDEHTSIQGDQASCQGRSAQ